MVGEIVVLFRLDQVHGPDWHGDAVVQSKFLSLEASLELVNVRDVVLLLKLVRILRVDLIFDPFLLSLDLLDLLLLLIVLLEGLYSWVLTSILTCFQFP